MKMGEKVIVLEPGDEQAQKIAKAMGSRMASDILQLLGEGQQSLTDITGRLAIPMTTAKYHVENLLGAGLISGRIRREGFPSPLFQEHTLRFSPQYARARRYLFERCQYYCTGLAK